MLITAHCFLEKAQINKPWIQFDFNDKKVTIKNVKRSDGLKKGMVLDVTQKVDVKDFMVIADPKKGFFKFFNEKSKKYSIILQDVADLVEGLLSIHHNSSVPSFKTSEININLSAETSKEKEILKDNNIIRSFGIVSRKERGKEFLVEDEIFNNVPKARDHSAAISCFSQAIRFQEIGYQEMAFLLYFRILEGYFGNGTGYIERALHQNSDELRKYLKVDDKLINALITILETVLQLPSESKNGFKGVLSDIVLLRHKLIHFDAKNPHHHYNPSLRFELGTINNTLKMVALRYLQKQLR